MEQNTEKGLIKQIIEGDTALYSYFVKQYADKIFGMIYKIVRCSAESEELTQDVFLKAFNNLKKYQGKSQFSTWLYRIAYNTAISSTRKKRILYPAINDSLLNNISDNEVDKVFSHEDNETLVLKLEKALSQLEPEEKSLITLFYYSDKSVQDISEIMDISQANVKTKLYRVRKKLLALIKLDGYEKG